MKRFRVLSPLKVMLVTLLTCCLAANPALAKSPVKLQKWMGMIDLEAEGPLPFVLEGTASHLGKFTAWGEVDFLPIDDDGSLIGLGVVVFRAANGDLLVGNATWEVDPEQDGFRASQIHFSWADSVEFSDGTVVANTGRFVDDRPPGLVVIAIIALLELVLLPFDLDFPTPFD